ncbi:SDR family oxidoreductase [Pelagibacteraceae bacterium]|nr:SDR family oxidoreductase [Pelagibacteraceae bacterium]
MNTRMKKLLIFGYGYTSSYIAENLSADQYSIIGSSRNQNEIKVINKNINIINNNLIEDVLKKNDLTHILISVPPNAQGDIFIQNFKDHLIKNTNLEWLGYLSATNVYGHHEGRYVDELSETKPLTQKGIDRLQAENQWLDLHSNFKIPIKIFRLAGIYGPNRNIKNRILKKEIRDIQKEGQFFSRVHIEDIASIIKLSMQIKTNNYIYNIADDYPSSLSEVIQYICEQNQIPTPKKINYRDIDTNKVKQSFFSENKRVDNSRVKKDFSFVFKYPSFREGYKDI